MPRYLKAKDVPGSYLWYDRATGEIDLRLLAESATRQSYKAVPEWMEMVAIPDLPPNAKAPKLAGLVGMVERAWNDFGRP